MNRHHLNYSGSELRALFASILPEGYRTKPGHQDCIGFNDEQEPVWICLCLWPTAIHRFFAGLEALDPHQDHDAVFYGSMRESSEKRDDDV